MSYKNQRKVFLFTSIGIVLIGLFSCEKSEDTTPTKTISPTSPIEVTAGEFDSTNFYYSERTDSGSVAIQWDNQNLYGSGIDSMDLNNDGTADLIILLSVLNDDSLHLLNGMPNPFPYCELKTKGNFKLSSYSVAVPIGNGKTVSYHFVSKLPLQEKIDSNKTWYQDSNVGLTFWGENPQIIGSPPFGDWHANSGIAYIGIVNGDTKYGWVEVDARRAKRPKFMRSAMLK